MQPILDRASIGRPITREGVSFFPVYIHQLYDGVTVAGPGSLSVTELPNAQVPTLVVSNLTNFPVLLPAGWIVEGGRQNRVVNVPVLVPGRATLEIPVSCVEQGRWNGRGDFGVGRSVAPRRVRRENSRTVRENLEHGGFKNADQSVIWDTVSEHLSELQVNDAAHNLLAAEQAFDRDHGRRAAIDEIVALGPLPGQNGLIVSHGSRVVGADLFANQQMLASAWESLVTSYFWERVPANGKPSATRALRFLHAFASAKALEVPGTGVGTELHVTHPKVSGQALTDNGALVYASCFALAA
ncbi:MAG: ARPP-1 family domain-containing protein [Actinomycetota bacterium]